MSQLFTLNYQTDFGAPVSVHNLSELACDLLEARQRAFGGRHFWRDEQPHRYTPEEIKLRESLTTAA